MKNLRADIAELFEALDGGDRYAEALEIAGDARRARAVERTRMWRIENPKAFRALRKRCVAAWRKRHPDKRKAQRQRRYTRQVKRDREHLRALWRKAQRKRRAKLRAER